MNGFNVTRRSTNMLGAACDGGSSRPIDVYPCRDGMRRGFFYAPRPRDTARSPDRLVAGSSSGGGRGIFGIVLRGRYDTGINKTRGGTVGGTIAAGVGKTRHAAETRDRCVREHRYLAIAANAADLFGETTPRFDTR